MEHRGQLAFHAGQLPAFVTDPWLRKFPGSRISFLHQPGLDAGRKVQSQGLTDTDLAAENLQKLCLGQANR